MNGTIVIILIAIALLVLAVVAFLIIRRQRYVQGEAQRTERECLAKHPDKHSRSTFSRPD